MSSTVAYSYVRFSTTRQEHGDSLRRQATAAEAYCRKHGLTLDDSLSLRDMGVSGFAGRHSKTGALSRFLLAIEDGQVAPGSTLLVENLDRLSREQLLDALHTFRRIVQAGVKVVTLKPERAYTLESLGDDYVMMEAIFDMMRAHRESQRKSDLGKSSWVRKRQDIGADVLTGRVPAWIKVVDRVAVGNTIKGGRFELIVEHATLIRQIFAWAIEGQGQTAITKKLNDGGQYIGRVDRWNKSFVAKILSNRAVFGEFQPHVGRPGDRKPIGDPIPDYYPKVVSEADFYAAAAAMAGRKQAPGRKGADVRNLFTGLLYDARGGSTLNVAVKDGVRLYPSAALRGERGSTSVGFSYDHVERAILHHLREVQPGDLDDATPAPTADLERHLADVDVKILDLNDAIISNPTIGSLIPTLAKLETQRREVAAQLEEAKRSAHDVPDLAEVHSLLEVLDNVDTCQRAEVRTRIKARIRQVVKRIDCLFLAIGRQKRVAVIQVTLATGRFRQLVISSTGEATAATTSFPSLPPTLDLTTKEGVESWEGMFGAQPVGQ